MKEQHTSIAGHGVLQDLFICEVKYSNFITKKDTLPEKIVPREVVILETQTQYITPNFDMMSILC